MMNEQQYTLGVLATRLGRKVSSRTLWRWATRGVRGVKLEARRLGRCWYSSVEAVDRFGAALAELGAESRSSVQVDPSRSLRRSAAKQANWADQVLDAAGI